MAHHKMRRAHKTPALLLAPAALAFVLAIGGCAYHLGPYTPSPPMNCCHTSDH
jgi:hypothetical protein